MTFAVDAFTGRTFEGKVRYVSPSLRADQRALTVEAVVPNSNGRAQARHVRDGADRAAEEGRRDARAGVRRARVSGTSRVFVVTGDHVEERLVTTGQVVDQLVEVTSGLNAGERVATANVAQLVDGVKVK